ncbi:MAG: hypothetical protein H0X66_07910 [Verrucomicrobia bacterium]|nr:hypothetical protein [Verrucomicrobiota bacterium]
MRAEEVSRDKGWSRRKFCTVLGVVFALQVIWLFLFGRPDPAPLDEIPRRTSFRMLAKTLPAGAFDTLLVSDPALFVVPSGSSFSGAAWMNVKEMDYSPAEWTEPPRWLSLRPETLIGAFNQFVQLSRNPVMHVSEKIVPFEPPSSTRTTVSNNFSRVRVHGDIAGRLASELPVLNSWQNPEPLDRSVVEVGVNEAGQVVSMRLIHHSGLAAADQVALKMAGRLQFAPASATSLMLGKINFLWQTEPLAATNGIPVISEPR